ncbi:MAG: ABC-F family ATP-binding cassette domain-containing protein [Acidimicrobiales bacterium]
MILVDVAGLGAHRPGRPLFADLSVTISDGDRLGVVGLNGSGKSTLLRILAGVSEPEAGVVRRGRGVRVAFLDQDASLAGENIREAVGPGWEADAILDRLGMGGLAESALDTLSGGQRKRVALAKALLSEVELLILDEPTNHLDLDAIAWLEDRLSSFRGGLVVVTHDRHLLDRLTNRVLELDRGRGYVHEPQPVHKGSGYAAYLDGRAAREEQAATAERTRRNLARAELAWLRRGAPARTRKPKARIDAATALVDRKALAAARDGELALASMGTSRLGTKVIELHGVGHHFGESPSLFDGLDLVIEPGARLGLVGANGTGKSTLLDVIASRVTPAAGRVERGITVQIGYYDQLGVELDPSMKVRDVVAGPTRQPDYRDAALMERFWFDGDAQWAEVSTLSGGERRRLQLLLVLAQQPNVLLLDEPTNDLDLDTLRALEDFLETWAGALVAVSHDRVFLDRVAEHVIGFDGAGHVAFVPGGVAGWLAARAAPSTAATAMTTTVAPTRARTKRSPSTLRRLLATAERDVAALHERRAELADRLSATSDHAALARLAAQLAKLEEEVSAAETTWLRLASEAEASGVAT